MFLILLHKVYVLLLKYNILKKQSIVFQL